ncbi:amino acid transporter, transmembrane domain-containing protein [Artemisia annua]|uniref:Amino acid transporter, transmembrane domain-containing protein n=1 Tax=Artemisia annua TaxID=35608 RepID=A0A2U1NSU6_ARTAN|nr:amino acid transporter, transmembrane domain-containing protein [Artemisia annua]
MKKQESFSLEKGGSQELDDDGKLRRTGGGHPKTSFGLPASEDVSSMDKVWNDTLKSSPPENKVMKTATTIGISVSTSFYMLCGLLGYAAFGSDAPGNYLTGFGFYEPFWLVDIANLCIVIHLVGAYQVVVQPIFAFVENWSCRKWPESKFVNKEYAIGYFRINLYRVIWRSTYVLLASLVAMIFPFFNEFLALIGSTTFWPMAVYFPIEMYLSQAKIRRNSLRWISLKILSLVCLVVSLLAAAGSVRGLLVSVKNFKLFQSVS